MENFNIKSEFVLEKFQFNQNFIIPPAKNMNADSVINIYENMRDFFPKYQENNHDIILAPRLENILDNFEEPGIDESIKEELSEYVSKRIAEGGAPTDF